MLNKKISTFLGLSILVLSLASCGKSENSIITNTTSTFNTSNVNNSTSSDSSSPVTSADFSNLKLVTGENLAQKNSFKAEYSDLENNIEAVCNFASSTTVCVQNYQSVYRVSFNGHGWVTSTTHTLYGWGSGVIYYKALLEDGSYLYKLITNEHVVSGDSSCVEGEEEYQIYDENYDENISAELIGKNEAADIAVLQFVSEREYNAVALEDSSNIKVGSYVVAMGTPISLNYYNTATFGMISKLSIDSIQHDATINSGNSGGPLFSLNGNLVGINNAKLSGTTSSGSTIEGIYFAISNSVVSDAVYGITNAKELVL